MGDKSVNAHVGRRLRQARVARGTSLQALATAIDVSYQQLSKFERGENRVSASALFKLARALDVEFGFFFEGLEPGKPSPSPRADADLHLVLGRVDNPAVRARIVELVRTLEVSRL
ncbi:helix-turn-helix transcriptional regulator [uncultured Aureimonas sp.]|uniref:helix-turn-helix domain-containing protein n=1 Tax=uncultured Aureimonas sp. TaxID=1604662 RepID=UPI0025D8D344|nr:helix-turn-helix transcriptional regulator [uncultured Aureimonas sp.]